MIATKIQIVSNRMQNISTMIQMTDCTDYENAQLKRLYKMPIKSVQINWMSSLSRDVRKFVTQKLVSRVNIAVLPVYCFWILKITECLKIFKYDCFIVCVLIYFIKE